MALAKTTCSLSVGANAVTPLVSLNWAGREWANEDLTPFDSNLYTVRAPTLRTDGPVTIRVSPLDEADTATAALITAATGNDPLEDIVMDLGPMGTYSGEVIVTMQPQTDVQLNAAATFVLTPTSELTLS